LDINNAGQVVGRAFSADQEIFPPTDPEYFSRAFLWVPGQGMVDLGDLGGGHSIAYAINDAGQVVGRSWLSTAIPDYGFPYRAFLWTSGQGIRSLGTLSTGPSASVAYGINEAGQVVGVTDTGPFFLGYYPLQAFVWSAADGIEAITPTTGIQAARRINDRNQVIGDGRVATLQLMPANSVCATGAGFYRIPGQGNTKAHVSFSVKFTAGRLMPNGTAKFWIPGARMDFESTSLEMLVVSGNRAQFWGTGVLNGSAARFRITAVDGETAGPAGVVNAVRIELWQAGVRVFDTQGGAPSDGSVTTPIEGGSIQLHRE
jgi:probable HAF family extracellular repeat protein